MNTPRLRLIGGSNGSGKTTLTRYLIREHSLSFGFYINADDIETRLRTEGCLAFAEFNFTGKEAEVKRFFAKHPLNKNNQEDSFVVADNRLMATGRTDGYFAAVLSDYIRRALMQKRESFSFETVMSGEDKIALLHEAHRNGYRNYLYYICTDDVLINKERINGRILMGEHAVPEDKIISRYSRSLDLLLDAIKVSDRAYPFDNSGQSHELIAEVTDGNTIDLKKEATLGWFIDAVIKKLNAE